ncbi:Kynurenine 3-monooxygenase [Oopsacas minuta]|uniref:Kynurenine 3-monooxygenase n=1 Tax=Oopsacas minuta TaxID=111878 RepID=A0AAV7JYL0_9METZ|nr:Kynurenine 3-monooxygenase [Oopsacas minuta]
MSIIVVGGGLVGSLHALMLARLGFEVRLFDTRIDPRIGKEEGKSINLALSTRGRHALGLVECEEEVLATSVPMRGRYIHNKDETYFTLDYSPNGDCIHSVNRKKLNELLLEKAEQKGVKIFFRHKCSSVNFVINSVSFEKLDELDGSNNPCITTVKYDYLFGCDGANSIVRKEMIWSLDLFSQEFIQHNYKELEISMKDDDFAIDPNYLHIWPRNEFMLIALGNHDKSFTLTLFVPRNIFADLDTNQKVVNFFKDNFPDAMELIGVRKLTDDFFANPTGRLLTVKCNPYHHRSALLLGDAAHAMVPFFGQGMNSGFEDCEKFISILQKNDNDFKLAMTEYSLVRHPDSLAVCQLSLYNYVEMRAKVNSILFRIRRKMTFMLAKIFPSTFKPLYPSVAFTSTPYSEVIKITHRQDMIINRLLISLAIVLPTVCTAAVIFYLVSRRSGIPNKNPDSYPEYIITLIDRPVRYAWSWVPGDIQKGLGNTASGVFGYFTPK